MVAHTDKDTYDKYLRNMYLTIRRKLLTVSFGDIGGNENESNGDDNLRGVSSITEVL